MRRLATAVLAALAPVALAAQEYPTTPPPPAPLAPASFPPFQEAVLPNGLRLVLVQSSRQPVTSISLSFPAGTQYAPPGKEGLAQMVAGLLTKGAGRRSAEEVSAAIEGVGGSLFAGASEDFLTIRASVLKAQAPLAFELIADAVMRPTFDPPEIELLRTQTLSSLQLELSQPDAIGRRWFDKRLYGGHPYGRSASPETVKGLTRNDLVAFQKERLVPGGALLVVAGDISLAEVRRLATTAFAGWTGRPKPGALAAQPPRRTGTDILLVHRPGAVQSNLYVGNLAMGPADQRRYAATIANKVLGGGADARLFLILREQKSWTYGAYSRITRPRGLGAFGANAEVRTEVTDSALRELLAQLRRLGTEAVPPDEMDAAKGALVGSFPLTIETAEQIAGAVADAKLLGLPADYLQTYRTRLAAVTPQEVMAVARAVMRPEAAAVVVVGDATRLHDKLSAIAPVSVITPEGKPLAKADLEVKAAGLPFDVTKLVARSDSFAILVQGQPFGAQSATLAAGADGFTYTESVSLGPIAQQRTELRMGPAGEMLALAQTGMVQGQETKIAATYAGGRVKGAATTPSPQGPKSVTYDTTVVAGTLDENAISAVIPALAWTANASWSFPVFGSGKGDQRTMTLKVTGTESVKVLAGEFETFRAELTGGERPVTFSVTTSAPHRVVRIQTAGLPIDIQAAK